MYLDWIHAVNKKSNIFENVNASQPVSILDTLEVMRKPKHTHPFDCPVSELARRLGVQRSYLSRVLNQGSKNEAVCAAIERETRGAVRAVDLIALKMRLHSRK